MGTVSGKRRQGQQITRVKLGILPGRPPSVPVPTSSWWVGLTDAQFTEQAKQEAARIAWADKSKVILKDISQ